MMTPYTVNFKRVRRNVDWYHIIKLTSNGTTPIDISDATFFMRVVNKATLVEVLDLSLDNGLELTTDGTDGQLSIHVSNTVMETIAVGVYKYDLVIVRNGVSETVMEGSVKVVDGVTEL